MKKIVLVVCVMCYAAMHICAVKSTIKVNGTQETEIALNRDLQFDDRANHFGQMRWGVNSLTNLRMRTDIGEYVSFSLAVNVNLLSGLFTDSYKSSYLTELASYSSTAGDSDNIYDNGYYGIPFYYKSTYIGGFELERASFKAGNMFFDVEMGVIRIAHGFGYAFSPNDFFNPKNPYNQNARVEGKLAALTTLYPADMWKVELFTVAPDNPLESACWGMRSGISTMFALDKVNFEFLYTLQMPEIPYHEQQADLGVSDTVNNDFSQIVGFSMKADIEIGLFIDMLYRFDHRVFWSGQYYDRDFQGYDGLEAAIGADYTLPGGKIYLLTEYMFYGPGVLDWDESLDDLYSGSSRWDKYGVTARSAFIDPDKKVGNFLRHDYLYMLIRGKVNDYLTTGGSIMAGLDDFSAIASLFAEIEPLQAVTLEIRYTSYLDRNRFDSTQPAGEFGPLNTGTCSNMSVTAKLKF